jgi:hypothetical protein
MKLRLLFSLLLALPLAATADEIWPDAAALPEASFPRAATKVIAIGKGVTINAKFELTEKGNGGLTIPGWGVRVYDAQRDGITFRNYLLSCEWKDTNADGYLDLVVSGTAQYWSEKGDRLEIEKAVTAVFTYDATTKAFSKVQAPSEILTWTNRATATGSPTPSPAK